MFFDKQYRFYGSYAEKVSALTAVFDDASKSKFFVHNYDVFINAPLIGFLYNRKGKKDSGSKSGNFEIAPQNIFPEQMINMQEISRYNLRLILLLDTTHEPDPQKRLDKAFRHLEDKEDTDLFEEYLLGGVEVLYEKLIAGANSTMDYINNLYDFIEDFDDKFNSELSSNSVLDLCNTINLLE